MNVWFTSDTHFYHRNIAGPDVSTWKSGYRDFENEYIMTDHLIDQINKYVKKNDILYHLGDWSFGGIDKIWEARKRINCENIHLILGNHDHHIAKNNILPNIYYYNKTILEGNIVEKMFDDLVRSHYLFSSVRYVDKVKFPNSTIFMSHYAHRVWNKSHHGVIHLYGHSHASIDDNWGKSMDVGVDNAYKLFGEYRPFHLNEIVNIMNKREPLFLDHHDRTTN